MLMYSNAELANIPVGQFEMIGARLTTPCNQRVSGPSVLLVGFSVRAMAQCANRAGFSSVAIDACADRDLLAICREYRPLSGDWLSWVNEFFPDVPIILGGGMEHKLNELSELACLRSAEGNTTLQAMAQLRSLNRWQQWAHRSGLSWPRTVRSCVQAETLAVGDLDSAWLAKPERSVGGLGIEQMHRLDRSTLDAFFENCPNRYLQKKRNGVAVGVTFLSSQHGATVVGCTAAQECRVQPFVPQFLYRGSTGPIPLDQHSMNQLVRFSELVSQETNIMGLWQADFIVESGDWCLLEINPRWTASMEIFDTVFDIRLVDLHRKCQDCSIDSIEWNRTSVQLRERSLSPILSRLTKVILYAPRDLVISQEMSDDWWVLRWTGEVPIDGCRIADIPSPGSQVAFGQPVFTAISFDQATAESFVKQLSKRLSQ
ncbi:MAG: ATP-grasp domain-containing protein [Pirellula sp.]